MHYYAKVRLGWSENKFWAESPRHLFAMIDQDKEQRLEDAISIGYATRVKDPGDLRPKTEADIMADQDANFDKFFGM